MNAGTCWEQEYNKPNGLSVEKAPKSDLYLTFTFKLHNEVVSAHEIDVIEVGSGNTVSPILNLCIRRQ